MKLIIVVEAAAVALLMGCGGAASTKTVTRSSPPSTNSSTSVIPTNTEPDTGTAPGTTTPSDTTTAPTPGAPVALGTEVTVVGQAIVGQAPDAQLRVKVTGVPPIPSSDYPGLLPPQQAADSVKLVIQNTGDQPFTDDLSGNVELLAGSGQTGSPDLLPPSAGFCAQNVNASSLSLQPGQTVHVCVPAMPPVNGAVASVRFTPDQGQSMDYAEWKLH